MEWKEAMAYLSKKSFCRTSFSISLALMPRSWETFIDFIKYIVESRKQLQKKNKNL
jgi:hypothetical protein